MSDWPHSTRSCLSAKSFEAAILVAVIDGPYGDKQPTTNG